MLRFLKRQLRRRRLLREGIVQPILLPVTVPGGAKGWPLCPQFIDRESVVYSFGVGNNVVWDLAMIEQFGTTVHAFDPTPESVAWAACQSFPAEFQFHDYGIAAFDGLLDFYPPKKAGRMHYSQDLRKHNRPDEIPFRGQVHRLEAILHKLGHSHVDVLKLDVEGSEFESLPDILRSGIPVRQLLIELHYHFPTRSFGEGLELLRQLREAGFLCHFISPRGMEFSFIHEQLLAAKQAA